MTFLETTHNQISYKKGVGTKTCVYLLKEIAHSYLNKRSFLHAAFLDSSKAFDKINHKKLFKKLQDRDVPDHMLSFLSSWYSQQKIMIKWDGCFSESFAMTNGVRQGSLLSPLLFSLYMDDLSCELNTELVGCFAGNKILNHILYADDIVLLSPSIIGLRRLLNICEKYADDFDITFNSNKCKCITFCSGRLPFIVGKVVFCQTELCWCDEITYLGVKLSCNLDDRNEILSQLRNFYARSNLVIRRFYKCSTSVKLRLFHAFCCNIYLYQVWLSFPKFIINRFCVARNNCLRKLIGLPYHCSASEMHVFYRVDDFDGSLRKARALMYLRLVRTQNSYVESYLNSEEFLSSKFRLILLEQTLV